MNISLKKLLKLEFDMASKKESLELLDDLEKCNEALLITPYVASLHHQRAKKLCFFALSQLRLNRCSVAEELYIQAADAYQQSIQLEPNESYFYLDWTSMMYNYAKILYDKNKVDVASHFLKKACNKANELCIQVYGKYENVIEADIDEQHYLYLDIAGAFIDMAILYFELEHLEKAEELYEQACGKYEQAIMLKTKNPDPYLGWGYSLGQLAAIQLKYKDFAKAEKLYKQACSKYEQAMIVDGKYQYTETYLDWGYSLGQWATIRLKHKDFVGAEQLCEQACSKYEQAITMDDKNTDAYFYWGYNLGRLARLKAQQGCLEASEELYVQACAKYKQVYNATGRAYQLARIYALINDKDNALKFLTISIDNKERKMDYILKDNVWKSFLQDTDFKQFQRSILKGR